MKNELILLATLLALGACNRSDTREASRGNAATTIANSSARVPPDLVVIKFIREAIEWDDAGIAAGQLAETQGGSQQTKDFGRMLVEDLTAHKKELQRLAEKSGTPIPATTSETIARDLESLKRSGARFDELLKAMIVEHHTREIKIYEEKLSSSDPELVAFAERTLPMLRKQLEAAKSL